MTVSYSNISATTAAFVLSPGLYNVGAHATWSGGSVTLQQLAVDGTTWLTALTAFSADGVSSGVYLAGTYRVLVTTATGVYVAISTMIQY